MLECLEAEFPPGLAFPAHIHRKSDEAFYVVEGELELQIGDRTEFVGPGGFAFAPRGTPHGFANKGASSARALTVQVPRGDFEAFFDELAKLPPGPPDPEVLVPILMRFDIEPVGAP